MMYFTLHMWWQQKSWKHNVYISFLGDFVYLYRTVVHTNSKIYIMFLLMFIFTRNTCKRLLTLTFVNCCLSVLLFYRGVSFFFMVLNTTFNNISVISWQSVLLVEETGVLRENHWPVASHWQTLPHNVVSKTHRHEQDSNSQLIVVIGTDCVGSCESNYHTITITTPPVGFQGRWQHW